MAGALPEKMAALILSDLPTPLQKHRESPKTPMIRNGGSVECVGIMDLQEIEGMGMKYEMGHHFFCVLCRDIRGKTKFRSQEADINSQFRIFIYIHKYIYKKKM